MDKTAIFSPKYQTFIVKVQKVLNLNIKALNFCSVFFMKEVCLHKFPQVNLSSNYV